MHVRRLGLLTLLLAVTVAADAEAQSPHTIPFPQVMDANGFVFGHFTGGNGIVFITENGATVQGTFFPTTGFFPPDSTYTPPPRAVYFVANDCSGQAFLDFYTLIPTVVVVMKPNPHFLYPDRKPIITLFHSSRSAYDPHAPCTVADVSVLAARTRAAKGALTGFTPPFTVVLD